MQSNKKIAFSKKYMSAINFFKKKFSYQQRCALMFLRRSMSRWGKMQSRVRIQLEPQPVTRMPNLGRKEFVKKKKS